MTITVVFDPPKPSDSPAVFDSKAFTLLGDLNSWSTQANALAVEVSQDQGALDAAVLAASNSAGTATTKAGEASTSATTATTQAGIATTQAGIATTQAGIATTKAGEASTSAANAASSAAAAAAALSTKVSKAGDTMTGPLTLASESIPLTANNLPSLRPSLLLDFANSRSVDPRITFTRASTATRVNEKGLIEAVASGTPRIDFDPITLACKGLLIEEQRTNLLTYSEQFDNAAWTKANSTVSVNAAIAPDGATTADKLAENSLTSEHNISIAPSFSVLANTTYTFSIYAKAAGRSLLRLMADKDAAFVDKFIAEFDLSSGVVVNSSVGGTASGVTAQISNVGNGWYRCSVSGVVSTSSGASLRCVAYLQTVSSVTGYTGDGTSGLYIWGAQLEQGSFPTSYIPTTTAQVTRASDVAVMTGSNFTSWYRQDEGTLLLEAYASSNPLAIYGGLSNGSSATNAVLFDTSEGQLRGLVFSGGNPQAVLNLGAVGQAGAINKLAIAYQENNFAAARNGGASVTDASGALPLNVSQLDIGRSPTGVSPTYINTHIRRITYYPKRISNAELQALTTP